MLSQGDQKRLAKIERHLAADDPRFARRMSTPPRPRRRRQTLILLTLLAAAAIALAFTVGTPAVIVTVLAVVLAEAGWRLHSRAARTRPGT